MKLPALLLAWLAAGSLAPAEVSPTEDPRAQELITRLKLEPLPGESGYFAPIGRSDQSVETGGQSLPAQSQIFYLLTAERPVNYLHWLASDDTHVLLEGGPVDYFVFHPDGRAEKLTLGRDLGTGQQLVIAVPGNCWKALRLHPGARYALMANILSPAWTPERVKIGAGDAFIRRYAGQAGFATEAFLRELIGPNWRQ